MQIHLENITDAAFSERISPSSVARLPESLLLMLGENGVIPRSHVAFIFID